ncbi:CHASE4 domain-containing protein [uncultured Ilyobacter sp.]|uniref:CHASE4 domain-containing protein n=1 Tax=uncultured Ilyobacter sp. TaxID=544433 RepID=UPI0029C82640|nr:CHASE4 domain-containing protein [uncultured Ilyobacter sp.]
MRKKIIISITLSSFIIFFLLFWFISENIKKDYKEFELRRSIARYSTIKNEFKSLSDNLKTLNSDWGMWDDTYEFVQNKNEKYIKSNLGSESIETLGIDYLYITNLDGKTIYSTGYDHKNQRGIVPPEKLLFNLLDFDDSSGIYIDEENKVMIFSSDSITDSLGLKKSIGRIIMAYEFQLDDLNNKLGTQLEFLHIKPLEENTFEVNISQDKVYNKFYIPSVSNKSLVLKDSLDADILVLGKDSIEKYAWMFFTNLIVLILIISFRIEKLILSRLKKIEISVEEIIEKKDLSRRLEVAGNDEISLLKKISMFF